MGEPESGTAGTADIPDPPGTSSAADPPGTTTVVPVAASKAGDRSPWNWLFFLPIVIPLITPLFNMDTPRLFGFPVFYWLQLAFIVLGVTTTTLVYQLTKRRG
jgi:hypothetical protein